MSYEGEVEYICDRGHYSIFPDNGYNVVPTKCSCGRNFRFHHFVNHTNGYNENDPSTFRAKTINFGHEDKWHVDHYGNRYATKVFLVGPVSSEWKRY